MLEELGYPTEFADTAARYTIDSSYLNWLRGQDVTDARLAVFHRGRSASVSYWWRGSPSVLVPDATSGPNLSTGVTLSNPPRTTPGMISLRLDTKGRLLWLDVIPDRLTGQSVTRPLRR